MIFKDLNIISPILQAIQAIGYNNPTPIQEAAIPIILSGSDIIGCAQTGTGKTAAFAIPTLQLLAAKKKDSSKPRVLVLTPTRELALQVFENFVNYGKHLPYKQAVIYGGVSQVNQVKQLKNGIDIIVATPGRLLDLSNQKLLDLSGIETLILDEADNMLDMGFIHDIKKVLAKIPAKRQTLFFSATMPPAIRKFANSILNNPKEISVNPVSSASGFIDQSVYKVEKGDKTSLLIKIIKDEGIKQSLVFTRTKHGADRLVKQLGKAKINAMAIHGNKSQNARQRALNDFKNGALQILVATDIAARGIDIDELPHVVNYELPDVSETYVHRIGRTGRSGKDGTAIAFCSSEENGNLANIEKLIGQKIAIKKIKSKR